MIFWSAALALKLSNPTAAIPAKNNFRIKFRALFLLRLPFVNRQRALGILGGREFGWTPASSCVTNLQSVSRQFVNRWNLGAVPCRDGHRLRRRGLGDLERSFIRAVGPIRDVAVAFYFQFDGGHDIAVELVAVDHKFGRRPV